MIEVGKLFAVTNVPYLRVGSRCPAHSLHGSAPLRPIVLGLATNACRESRSVGWFPASSETFQ